MADLLDEALSAWNTVKDSSLAKGWSRPMYVWSFLNLTFGHISSVYSDTIAGTAEIPNEHAKKGEGDGKG